MTQGERIVDYCRQYGSITPLEAFKDLGITKLATRVSELISEGTVIYKKSENCLNRFGERTSYMRYSLKPFEEIQ